MTAATFPEDIVSTIEGVLKGYLNPDAPHDEPYQFARRPLRLNDPEQSVGIFCSDWRPQQDTAVIGQAEPQLSTYTFTIQLMVKHQDPIAGGKIVGLDGKVVRAVLYRDESLRVALHDMQETLLGTIERLQRYGVRGQRYLRNELNGNHIYMVTTDLFVETEVTAT